MASLPALAELPAVRVSFSSISSFLRCPRAHACRYILKEQPTFRPVVLAFGTAVHEALAFFYAAHRDNLPEPSIQDLKDSFEEAWQRELRHEIPVLLDEGQTEESLLAQGQAMLAVFHEEAPRPHRVIAVEAPFAVEIYDPATGEILPERLAGYFDAVIQDETSRVHVVEHKTAARKWSEDRLANDLQITAYDFAAQELGFEDAQVTVQVLLKQKEPALTIYTPQRGERDHQDFLAVASGVLKAIAAGADHPIRDWQCKTCGFAGRCLNG